MRAPVRWPRGAHAPPGRRPHAASGRRWSVAGLRCGVAGTLCAVAAALGLRLSAAGAPLGAAVWRCWDAAGARWAVAAGAQLAPNKGIAGAPLGLRWVSASRYCVAPLAPRWRPSGAPLVPRWFPAGAPQKARLVLC